MKNYLGNIPETKGLSTEKLFRQNIYSARKDTKGNLEDTRVV